MSDSEYEYSAENVIKQLKDDCAYMRRLYKEYKEENAELHEEIKKLREELKEKEKPVVKSSYVSRTNVTPISDGVFNKKPYVKRDWTHEEKMAWYAKKKITY